MVTLLVNRRQAWHGSRGFVAASELLLDSALPKVQEKSIMEGLHIFQEQIAYSIIQEICSCFHVAFLILIL